MVLRQPPLHLFDPDAPGDETAGIFGLPFREADSSLVLLGYPWEATTSYGRGTALGPQAIAQASSQLDLIDLGLAEFGLACPYKHGIFMRPPSAEVSEWNREASRHALAVIDGSLRDDPEKLKKALHRVNELSQQLNARVQSEVQAALESNQLVGLIGGDHSVPLGAIAAHAARESDFGILHIDAHADLRCAYEGFTYSHASIMYNVLQSCASVSQIVQVGIRDLSESEYELIERDERLETFFGPRIDRELSHGRRWTDICAQIIENLPQRVYVSFDIDGLDPTLCPHTGTPVPGGLSYSQAQELLLGLVRSERELIGFDLCEVAPPLNIHGEAKTGTSASEWDANVGARFLYRLCGILMHSNGARDRS